MRSIIWTIVMFLSVIALTSFVAIADGSESVTLDVPGDHEWNNRKVIRFKDGDVTCYMPANRSGISCIKN
jgi:hypothetical protein